MSDGPDPLAGARPIHTRTLDVEVCAVEGAPGIWDVRGVLVDLRKGGFVPIAANLQAAGLLHHMGVTARLDATARTFLEVSADQPVVAFEASGLTEGESCRDPVANLGALAGAELAKDWDGQLREAMGGPRGCSHVLALARLVGATLAWLLDTDAGWAATGWRPGERLFHRSLCFDGAEHGENGLGVDLQLTDLHCAPAPDVARPMARLARQSEVRGRAVLARQDLVLRGLGVARRQRSPEEIETAEWRDFGAELQGLVGATVARGMRRRVLESLPGETPGAPLAAALLDLAPAVLQCVASDCDYWPAVAASDPSLVVSAGLPDSCWMWRAEGALTRAKAREARTRR